MRYEQGCKIRQQSARIRQSASPPTRIRQNPPVRQKIRQESASPPDKSASPPESASPPPESARIRQSASLNPPVCHRNPPVRHANPPQSAREVHQNLPLGRWFAFAATYFDATQCLWASAWGYSTRFPARSRLMATHLNNSIHGNKFKQINSWQQT